MELTTAIDAYIKAMRLKNLSPRTITEHARYLTRFAAAILPKEKVEDLSLQCAQHYLRESFYRLNRFSRQDSAGTRNHEIGALRAFVEFCFDNEWLAENFAEKLEYIKESRLSLPKGILTARELKKMFGLPDPTSPKGVRDRVILEVLYATGMRRAELASLAVTDVDFEQKVITVRQGKNRQDRVVPVNATALAWVKRYLAETRPVLANPRRPVPTLITSITGRPIAPKHLNAILAVYLNALSAKKKVTIHSLRHTVATHVLQRGMPLRSVQEFLGHRSLNSTIRYVHLSVKDLQREYRRCHPRERN